MKKIIRIIAVLLCVVSGRQAAAQTLDDYFLLGTFSDYMGYHGIDTAACELDCYNADEQELVSYIHMQLSVRYGSSNIRTAWQPPAERNLQFRSITIANQHALQTRTSEASSGV